MEEIICNKCKIPSYTASPKQAQICPHCHGLGVSKFKKVKELSRLIRQSGYMFKFVNSWKGIKGK